MDAQSRLKPPAKESPLGRSTSSARIRSGPETRDGILASGTWNAASQVEHMAAPTSAVQKLQKILANLGPSRPVV